MLLKISLTRLLRGFCKSAGRSSSAACLPEELMLSTCPHCKLPFELKKDKGFMASHPGSKYGVCWNSIQVNEQVEIYGLCPSCSQSVMVIIQENGTKIITARG